MAELGQCKTCRKMVSMEAAACPQCGQPNPAIAIPPDGTICSATIESVVDGGDCVGITLIFKNGLWAMCTVGSLYVNKYKVGQTVHVKVFNTNLGAWSITIVD